MTPTPDSQLQHCATCGRDIPAGEFCGACGAHLLSQGRTARDRVHAFAANPNEHVFHLSLVSTLFPHLPHRRSAPFRLALLGVVGALVVLGVLRLTPASIAVAAVSVPLIYLVYLYEAEVYQKEPVLVVGATFFVGLLVGIPWAIFTGPIVTGAALQVSAGSGTDGILLAGVVLPVATQLIMLLGALALFFSRRYFDEALDGFTFGAAAALGFSLSTAIVNLLPELRDGLYSVTPVAANVLHVVQRGLLVPIINASTTGLVAGALWLGRGRTRNDMSHTISTSLVVGLVVAMVAQVGLGLVSVLEPSSVISVGAYAATAVFLLLWVRLAIHYMLLSEAVDVTVGPAGPCSHCYRVVPRMPFCPNCGVATRATPKSGTGASGRAVREGA